jgi:hypothetical protein
MRGSGLPGRAVGPPAACGEQAWPKGQALAAAWPRSLTSLAGWGPLVLRSALGLSSTYMSSANGVAASPAENLCCCARIKAHRTEDGLSEQS